MRKDLPIACNLSGREFAERRQALADDVFGNASRIEELGDGYEFGFPGDAGLTERLVGVINAERSCCPFLSFALFFGPDGGPISLRVTGPEGTKAFIENELMTSGRMKDE